MDYKQKYLKYKSKYLNLKYGSGKVCKIQELFDAKDESECNNNLEVVGSCAEPSWKDGYTFNISEDDFNKINNTIENIPKDFQKIIIILGSRNIGHILPNTYYITIDPAMINQSDTINIKNLNAYFPLRIDGEFDKKVLDIILKNKNKIKIINKMCGTCHRSLYYLVQNGVEYEVLPEQGLGILDTIDVQKCFDYTKFTKDQLEKKIASEITKKPKNLKLIQELSSLLEP